MIEKISGKLTIKPLFPVKIRKKLKNWDRILLPILRRTIVSRNEKTQYLMMILAIFQDVKAIIGLTNQ